MLPYLHGTVAGRTKNSHVLAVAGFVARDLSQPIRSIGRRQRSGPALRAPMPETTVNVYGDPFLLKDEVRTPGDTFRMSPPSGESRLSQCLNHSQLGTNVASALDSGHDSGPLGRAEDIGH